MPEVKDSHIDEAAPAEKMPGSIMAGKKLAKGSVNSMALGACSSSSTGMQETKKEEMKQLEKDTQGDVAMLDQNEVESSKTGSSTTHPAQQGSSGAGNPIAPGAGTSAAGSVQGDPSPVPSYTGQPLGMECSGLGPGEKAGGHAPKRKISKPQISFVKASEEEDPQPAKRSKLTVRELAFMDPPRKPTQEYLDEMDLEVRGEKMNPEDRVVWVEMGSETYQIVDPKDIPEDFCYLNTRALSLVSLLTKGEYAQWLKKWMKGSQSWPTEMEWNTYVAFRMPGYISNLREMHKRHVIRDLLKAGKNAEERRLGLGYGTPQAIMLTDSSTHQCPSCRARYTCENMTQSCMVCKVPLEELDSKSKHPEAATTVQTRHGTWVLHPKEQEWMLFCNGVMSDQTKNLTDEWAMDLTVCSGPMKKLDDSQKNELYNMLKEISENTDTWEKGWSIKERMETFFEKSDVSRQNIEEAIAHCNLGAKIRLHHNEGVENEDSLEPKGSLSFHPYGAQLGSVMKAAGGNIDGDPSDTEDEMSKEATEDKPEETEPKAQKDGREPVEGGPLKKPKKGGYRRAQ